MATNWDMEMKAQFEQMQRALTDELGKQFVTFGGQLEARIDARFSEAEARLGTRLEERIDKRLTDGEERLTEHISKTMQVHAESLRDIVQTAADNYGGVLGRIDRELGEFRAEWRQKASDTDRVLANHNDRLQVLEDARSSAR